jgi:hypothetical protein
MAHGAFIIAIVLDGFRRESAGIAFYVFSLGSAIFVLTAFLYFVLNPCSFFLIPSQRELSEDHQAIGRIFKIVLFFVSWVYVAGWSVSWLLFAPDLPRPIASYGFMFGVVTTLLISKYLFIRPDAKESVLI